MSDLHARLDQAREHVATEWTPERQRRTRAKFEGALMKRTRARRAGLALAVAAVCAVALFLGLHKKSHAPVAQQTAPAVQAKSGLLFRLHDGTTVSSVAPKTRVDTVEASTQKVVLRVVSGVARFDVAHQNGRQFHVVADQVRVTVIGTRFTVSNSGAGVRVRVERGHVRVDWPSGSIQLYAGEERLVPHAAATAMPASPQKLGSAAPPQSAAPPPASAPAPRPVPSWRDLAQSGDYEHAYHRLLQEGSGAVRDEPGDLLLAADVARLGGHPADSVKYLQKVVSNHAGDARAPLAAFTLGRVLLDELGRPRAAAQAFATALRLAPHGALAQDALAREVEAWSRAGESVLARQRAEQYLSQYPHGRRAASVRRFGGVD